MRITSVPNEKLYTYRSMVGLTNQLSAFKLYVMLFLWLVNGFWLWTAPRLQCWHFETKGILNMCENTHSYFFICLIFWVRYWFWGGPWPKAIRVHVAQTWPKKGPEQRVKCVMGPRGRGLAPNRPGPKDPPPPPHTHPKKRRMSSPKTSPKTPPKDMCEHTKSVPPNGPQKLPQQIPQKYVCENTTIMC